MIDWLREWHVKYAAVIWYLILGTLAWNYFPRSVPDFQHQIAWMESHDELSGWAQFYGASLALVVAIIVPAWQRYLQALDKKRDDAESNLANALGVFYLVSEVRNHLDGYLEKKGMPREFSREDYVREDLLNRIHALELRDNNPDRVRLLFLARGFIHQTHSALAAPYMQHVALTFRERSLIRARLEHCRRLLNEASELKDQAIFRNARMQQWWLVRLMMPTILRKMRKRREQRPSETAKSAAHDYRDRSQPKGEIRFKFPPKL
ncbi:hypothetical protein [Herbaspirillum huttiense]|uniref:hypothetical protein n=1 Tax=Herbaspirillum huttiense TaxID=863372 RepID=UPI00058543D0|nr:hypothetical protein [Herbaspirillum huttiense]